MKKLVVMMVIAMVFTTVAVAGTDATNSWLTIKAIVVNGTNAMEVVAYYPTNWVSGSAIQTSSDLSKSNNWSGVKSGEYFAKSYSLSGELPMWTKWIMKSEDVIGSRFFRYIKY